MNCPKCNGPSKVEESRLIDGTRIRRNRCKKCRFQFYSKEVVCEDAKHELYLYHKARNIKRKLKEKEANEKELLKIGEVKNPL